MAEAFRVLVRHVRLLPGFGLLVLSAAGWAYLLHLSAQMDAMTFSPDGAMTMLAPGFRQWSHVDFLATFVMWAVMMVAMMLPSAAPMILLHAAILARQGDVPKSQNIVFVFGYVTIWTGFSAVATLLQWSLEQAVLLTPSLAATDGLLGGSLLVVAGVYQATPFKNRCLSRCRAPVQFLSANWRTGATGAFGMGMHHGLYCLGCCWALMLLLFVGGVMNLLWIAALAAFVLMEKILPHGLLFARASGALMTAAGLWLFAQG